MFQFRCAAFVRWILLVSCSFATLVAFGCSSRPPRLVAPKVNPTTAAEAAMEMYDEDGDGVLSSTELAAVPGIEFNLIAYDTNGDKQVSADELLARLTYLYGKKRALCPVRASVTLNGRPLADARIEFVPEAYLGEAIKNATGTTTESRGAQMAVSPDDLPKAQRGMTGVHMGTYRVRITHATEKIPAKYNTDTTLGYEIQTGSPTVQFELRK